MDFFFILKVFTLVFITTVNCKETLSEKETKDNEILPVEKSVNNTVTKEMKSEKLTRKSISFWPSMEKDKDLLLLEQVLEDIERGWNKSIVL